MNAYSLYKVIHLFGMLLIFTSLGGLAAHAASGGTRESNVSRRQLGIAHGLGLVLMLMAGFGLLANTGTSMASGWVWGKMIIWLALGAASALPYRSPAMARSLLVILPLLGALAAYLAIFKPF